MPENLSLLLLCVAIVLLVNPYIKGFCQRTGMPSGVGYIILGLGLGELLPKNSSVMIVFEALASLGVIILLFRVGLRSHTEVLLAKLPQALPIWIGNVGLSAIAGYSLSYFLLGWSFESSLVIATAFSATSIAVSVLAWDEAGMLESPIGQLLIDVAELDDLSAAVMLAILVGTLTALHSNAGLLATDLMLITGKTILKLFAFIAGCYLFAHYLERRYTELNLRWSKSESAFVISILGAGCAIAAIADHLGFSVAIGAMFAGLAFSRDPEAVRADNHVVYFFDLLTPFFFVHIGMQTNLSVLINAADIGILLFIAAAGAKLIGVLLPALAMMNRRDALVLAISMIPRAEIALVVIYACNQIDETLVTDEMFFRYGLSLDLELYCYTDITSLFADRKGRSRSSLTK